MDDPSTPLLPCELRPLGRRGRQLLGWTLALVVIGVLAALVYGLVRDPGRFDTGFGFVLSALLLLLNGVTAAAQPRGRVVLTAESIEHLSGMPAALQWKDPDWRVFLHEIRAAYLESAPYVDAPRPFRIVLETDTATRRLEAGAWVGEHGHSWRELGIFRLRQSAIDRAPLVRFLRESGFALDPAEMREPPKLDLLELPRTRATLIAMPLIVAYAAVDALLGDETYASCGAALLLGALAVAISVGTMMTWVRREDELGAGEAGVVGVVLSMALLAALYPAALRLNRLTDGEGLRVHRYAQVAGPELRPLDEGAPELRFWFRSDYLSAFPEGTVHEIELRRGGRGFHQLPKSPLIERMRAAECG